MIEVVVLLPEDAPELLQAIEGSRTLHEPWVFLPATENAVRQYLDQPAEARITYGIREPGGRLAGVVNISSIVRGPFQNAFLSYFALAPFARQGCMRAGLAAVLDKAFGEHRLHRVEANIQPGNVASAGLVKGLGFRLEGHSPRYLQVGGKWRDHDRYALTREEWRPGEQ